ncbi:MAG: hypothetical protein ACRYG8_51355 [Janthinobacterium lividum]
MPGMTKSALCVARDALAAGEASLAPYGSRFSRRDYTQPQLFASLVLRQFLRTDYRGVVALASEWRELREPWAWPGCRITRRSPMRPRA